MCRRRCVRKGAQRKLNRVCHRSEAWETGDDHRGRLSLASPDHLVNPIWQLVAFSLCQRCGGLLPLRSSLDSVLFHTTFCFYHVLIFGAAVTPLISRFETTPHQRHRHHGTILQFWVLAVLCRALSGIAIYSRFPYQCPPYARKLLSSVSSYTALMHSETV